MTARTESFPREIKGRDGLKCMHIRGGTALTICVGDPIAHRRGSQLAEQPNADAPRDDLIFVGWAQNEVTITTDVDGNGAAVNADDVPYTVNVESGIGCRLDVGASSDALTMDDVDAIVFFSDTNTVNKTSGNGTRSPGGRLVRVDADGTAEVDIPDDPTAVSLAAAAGDDGPETFTVRNVITALGAYTASAGVITVTADGALATQDGITNAVGDKVWLPVYTNTANSSVTVSGANSGPYEIVSLGGVSDQVVLKRDASWPHGGAMPLGASVKVAEGSTYGGTTWRCDAAKGSTIGTTDPAAYPDKLTVGITLASGTLASALATLPVRSATKSSISMQSTPTAAPHANTRVWRVSALTPGPLGTASIQVVAESAPGTTNTSDVGTYTVTVFN